MYNRNELVQIAVFFNRKHAPLLYLQFANILVLFVVAIPRCNSEIKIMGKILICINTL